MKLLYSLGIVVAIIPFLGVPSSWKTVVFFVIGITIFMKAYSIYRHDSVKKINSNSSFKQNEYSDKKSLNVSPSTNTETEELN